MAVWVALLISLFHHDTLLALLLPASVLSIIAGASTAHVHLCGPEYGSIPCTRLAGSANSANADIVVEHNYLGQGHKKQPYLGRGANTVTTAAAGL